MGVSVLGEMAIGVCAIKRKPTGVSVKGGVRLYSRYSNRLQ